jgi:O-antigen biosynthesis protein
VCPLRHSGAERTAAAILEEANPSPVNHASPVAGAPLLCLYRSGPGDDIAAALASLPAGPDRIAVLDPTDAGVCAGTDVERLTPAVHANPAVAALLAAARQFPARDLLLLDSRARLPPHALDRLALAVAAAPDAQVWSTLTDAIPAFDPQPRDRAEPHTAAVHASASVDPDADIWLRSDRTLPETDLWSAHCSLWRAGAAAHLTDITADVDTGHGAGHRLPTGLRGRLCDALFVGSAVAQTSLDSDTTMPALPTVGALRARLADIAGAALPHVGLDGRPVLLHVLHGWGGGAERFVRDYIGADLRFRHLVLCAAGDPGTRRHGAQLALYVDLDAAPIRRWPLSAPILCTALDSAEYREVLDAIRRDFGVGVVMISSLIGHSLDALRTGLPTALVCHDYYPLWPRLHADFGDPAADFSIDAIPAALADAGDGFEFDERRAAYWKALRSAHVQALAAADVQLIAPTAAVRDNQCRIAPALAARRWQRIEHGLASWPMPPLPITTRADASPLRIVVPGRIRGGKGEQLLAQLIPTLPANIELILLGCGAAGMRFLGCRGVHLVVDYQRAALPSLLASLQADAALLPSTVAETYSYTLSELRSLGVPVIATRLGSFVERIRDGVDGLLVAPEPDALQKLLAALASDRTPLRRLQPAAAPPTLAAMAAAYAQALPETAAATPALRVGEPEQARAQQLEKHGAELTSALRDAHRRLERQQRELVDRADWALAQQRLAEQRLAWARSLESALEDSREQTAALDREFQERTAWALALDAELRATQAEMARQIALLSAQRDAFESERNTILRSSSWRLTAPMRWSRRKLVAVIARARFTAGRLNALRRRATMSLRTRGLRGTLARMRRELRPPTPPVMLELPDQRPALDIAGLELTPVTSPRASIIVPAYNHIEHSLTCLRALAAHVQRSSFEVILVDDCSSDETPSLLPQIPGLRFIRNPHNLGFIGACNAGAAAARGEFLVFLNNDTAVQPDWLDALLDTFDTHPDAGLVGAKLVYPDGRLQEAGGIVFSDGSGWNYGRFEDPADPRFNYLREVDYCSGAAIALRRELFEQLDGFDPHYAPAYYEDTDLAMRVRAAGLRVLYQPKSVVVHFEGVTSGTDTGSGVKAYQVVNQKKFLQRWQQVLATHAAPGTDIAIAREHRCGRRVLVIDATTPMPDQDSGSVRMVNLFRVLRTDGCAVTFFADNRAWVEGYTDALQQLGVEVLWHPYLSDPVSWFVANGARFDLVFVSRHYIASSYLGLIRMHAPKARFAFDTVDLHYLREQREAELADRDDLRRSAEETRRKELALIREADVAIVVSPVEQELLAVDAPGARVDVLSNVHEVFGCRRPFAERADLMFVGGFQHPPNIDAATWFVEEIFPLVRSELPEVRCHLIGSRAPDAVRALGERDGVVFHGFVEDLEPLLDGVRVAIAPLRYGAGVKGKINMSMSYGQPVVATTVAVEGMYLEPGRDVLAADDPAGFAAAVVQVYRDEALWNRLSGHGLANVQRHFSFDAALQAVRRLFE